MLGKPRFAFSNLLIVYYYSYIFKILLLLLLLWSRLTRFRISSAGYCTFFTPSNNDRGDLAVYLIFSFRFHHIGGVTTRVCRVKTSTRLSVVAVTERWRVLFVQYCFSISLVIIWTIVLFVIIYYCRRHVIRAGVCLFFQLSLVGSLRPYRTASRCDNHMVILRDACVRAFNVNREICIVSSLTLCFGTPWPRWFFCLCLKLSHYSCKLFTVRVWCTRRKKIKKNIDINIMFALALITEVSAL